MSLALFLLSLSGAPLKADLNWTTKGAAIGLEIATNPGGFLYDIHQLNETVVPTRPGRRATFSVQMLPTFLPFTMAGFSGRFNITKEHGGWPQIEVFGGMDRMLALDYLSGRKVLGLINGADIEDNSVTGLIKGRHYGISTAWSAHPKARVQLAYEISALEVGANFSEPFAIAGSSISSIAVNIEEQFILVGAELFRGDRHYLFTQMGYGLQSSKIMARIVFSGRAWDWGFTVFPEGALVIYPTLGFKFGL